MLVGDDLCTAVITIFLLHLIEIVFHHLFAKLGIVENRLQISNLLLQLLIFSVQLIHSQSGELRKSHVHDGLALEIVEVEALLQIGLSLSRCLAAPDDMHHLVDIVAGDDQSFKDMSALLGFVQIELSTADGHLMTVLHKIADALFQREQLRAKLQMVVLARHQRDAVHSKRALQRRHLKEFVEDDLGVGVFLHVDDDAHTLTAGLVVDIGDTLQLAFLDEVGDILDELLLVDTIRNLGDDDAVVAVIALDLGLGTHDDAALTGLVSLLDALQSIDVGTCGEVRSGDILHQSIGVDVGIVDISAAAINHLAQVVSRDIGSHTHGNTVTAVDQQVGHLGRHHGRLLERIVEVVDHIDGILLDVVHDMLAHLREPALGITHGSGRVTVNTTEVTLSVNKRIAHVPVLSHTHQGAIDRAVAMRMVLTQYLTHDTRTFLVRFITRVAQTQHTIEDTPVHRLESVSDIRKGTGHDH